MDGRGGATRTQLASALALGLGILVPPVHASEVERTIRAELSGAELSSFRVENLAGTMRIRIGAADRVSVVATVHAADASLAEAVRLERFTSGSTTTLLVRYPYSRVSSFRYRAPGNESNRSFLDVGSTSTYDYDGHQVRVNPGRGKPLYADLEVEVPAVPLHAAFRTLAGLIEADTLKGHLQFEVESADLRLGRLDGEIVIDSSSGDARASDIRGSWTSTFSSGDCRIDGLEGDLLSFHSSSGDLVGRGVKARRIRTETSSGDVNLDSTDLEEFEAEASSGDVALTLAGKSLRSVRVDTSSGNVSLALPADSAFDAAADQSSGDMVVGFADGSAVRDDDVLVGYRHGTGGARIRVTTSSGDFSINPL